MFDVQNIRPLFRLQMGEPGSSFAVEIARKIGLPAQIIDAASRKGRQRPHQSGKAVADIARDRRYWEQKRDRIRITDRRWRNWNRPYARQLADIKQERNRILHEARRRPVPSLPRPTSRLRILSV